MERVRRTEGFFRVNFSAIIRSVSKSSAGLALLALGACMLAEPDGARSAHRGGATGYVSLKLQLERNARPVLGKAAAADTTFELDSLIVVFSAPEYADQTFSYPLSGRADTGNIAVELPPYQLPALRNWQARIYSIDERENTVGRDTVHIDTVRFGVLPSDTVTVSKTVSPAFAILRARFLSTQADSVPNTVLWVRLRVDGVTRDSQAVGNSQSSLNWLQALSGSRIVAAGDSGKILRSTDNGTTWIQQTVNTTSNLVGGHFINDAVGFVVGRDGRLFQSTDSGKSWGNRAVLADPLNAVYMTGTGSGFIAGDSGAIYKIVDDEGWDVRKTISNTTHRLNGIHFPSASIGYAVGENETILKTTSGDTNAQYTGFILWRSVAGGWFPQNSQTTHDIRGVHFISKDTGWVAGANGYLRVTYNGGASWEERHKDFSINAVSFKGHSVGWIAGEGGVVRKFVNEHDWRNIPSAQVGTTEAIYDIQPASPDTAFLVGANGTLRRTVNAVQPQNKIGEILWSGMSIPVGEASAWTAVNSNTTKNLNAMAFLGTTTGIAVGADRTVVRTTDGGQTWSASIVGAGNNNAWRAIFALDANTAYIAGDGNGNGNNSNLRRTTNGGATWTSVPTGINATLHGVAAASDSVGWIVGSSSLLYSTSNLKAGTPSWTNRNVGSGDYNAVNISSGNVWVVGNNAQIRRAWGLAAAASFQVIGNAGLGSTNLRDVYFLPGSPAVGWVVGDGGLIAKTTSGTWGEAPTWVVQGAPVTENLVKVAFVNADTGYVVGDGGTVLKTVNGGTVWTVLDAGTTTDLRAVAALGGASNVIVAGANGTVLRTTIAGVQPGVAHHLRSVHPVTTTLVFVAGDSGTIARTTNGGAVWKKLAVPTSANLYGIHFANAGTGWAVGNGGVILKTVDGGETWIPQDGHTSTNLRSVRAVSADTAYISGENGLILKTINGGATWYKQETPPGTPRLNRVYFLNPAVGFVVGQNGTILKAVNQGDNWTAGDVKRAFKGVYFVDTETGWVVGSDGVILKTTDGGETWTEQRRQAGQVLYGVHFRNASVGWVTGENGLVLKTTNGGTTWSQQSTPSSVSSTTLRWVHFRNDNAGFVIGGTQTLLSTANGGSDWNANLAAGASGAKIFDQMLAYKYLKPGQPHTVILQAIDRDSPLRGYQKQINLTVGAGVDSTITEKLARCGHVDSLPCIP